MAAMGGIRGAGDGRLYADWLASGGWNPHDPVDATRPAESAVAASGGPTLPEVPVDTRSAGSGEHVGPQ